MTTRFLSLLALLAAAGLLAACGSSSSTSSSAAAASAGGGAHGTRVKLASCLKAHGVTLPSRPAGARRPPGGGGGYFGGGGVGGGFGGGGFGGGGFGARGGFRANPKLQAAFKACGARFSGRRFNTAQRRTLIASFVTCARKHGYKLPAANFSGHGSIFPAKIASDPKFRAASKSCVSLLRPRSARPA